MGRMLIEAIRASDDCVLAGALDVAASPGVGSDATAFLGLASGVAITADIATGLQGDEEFDAAMAKETAAPETPLTPTDEPIGPTDPPALDPRESRGCQTPDYPV